MYRLIQKISKCKGAPTIVVLLLSIGLSSCKKLVEIPPPSNSIVENNVYTNDEVSISVLTGIYASMNNAELFEGYKSINLLAGLSSDELTLIDGVTSQTHLAYYRNSLVAINLSGDAGSEHWAPLYNYVYKCNAAIDGLSKSSSLTPVIKQQLLGEAKFMRGFFYFYLVNLFGDLPLVLEADPVGTASLARSPKEKVYDQIIADLKDAEQLMGPEYLDQTLLSITTERVRPTKWAAVALLARVYLYSGKWAEAEAEASLVINNASQYQLLQNLNDVFLKNSREAIWQIQPTILNFNTHDAQTFIIPATGPAVNGFPPNLVYLNKTWLNNFEPGDERRVFGNWVDTTIYLASENPVIFDTITYVNKYKINMSPGVSSQVDMTEYFMVLRLAEQYLIRSEARAQQTNISGAQEDLNVIRERAGLNPTTANDEASLLAAILKERQVELFCEWGNRWLDLKRMGKVDEVMSIATALKTGGQVQWQSYQQWYPLPVTDLQAGVNLVQNPGY